jgi:hypothetical protein
MTLRRVVRLVLTTALVAPAGVDADAQPPFAPPSVRTAPSTPPPYRGDRAAAFSFIEAPLILEPIDGAHATIGQLRLRIGGRVGNAREAEVELVKHWHSTGVLDTATTWRAPVSALREGIAVPSTATAGDTGDFTLRVRIVAPFEGEPSSPVRVVLTPARRLIDRVIAPP